MIWRRRAVRWSRRLLVCSVLAGAVLSLALAFFAKRDVHDGISYSSAFFDTHGKLLRLELSADEKYRLWTPLKELSPHLVQATLLLEDRYFYWHPGVNPLSLGRALWQTFVTREATVGASTITMQLARLRYHLKTRTFQGKLRQMLYALRLEKSYSKDEILEAYLNLAPYGGNVEGAAAASEIYFQKRPRDLTVGESLLLAVLPQSPTLRAPGRTDSASASAGMESARDLLLERWLKAHPEQKDEVTGILLKRQVRRPKQLPFRAPHFVDEISGHAPVGAVATTLDLKLQSLLELKLAQYVELKKSIGIKNGAIMLLDYRTMATVGVVGSANFLNPAIQGQVNGTRAKRSPGSTLKPFIYGLAMDQALIHPMTLLKDAPTTFGEWRPENFDQDFAGPVKVHDALIRSRNVPAIQVAAELHKPSLYDFLRMAGVTGLRDESYYGLALALGGSEVTMEELVRMYAMLGNEGLLKAIRRLPSDPVDPGRRLLSPEAAYLVLDILKDNPRPHQGYEAKWLRDQRPVAWKTGTSFSFRDAWAVGIVGPYVLAVWIGNFDGESNPAFVGVEAAGPLFFDVVDALKAEGLPSVALSGLPKVRDVEICALSGKIPGPNCHHKMWTKFIPGKSPIAICDIHRAVPVDIATGHRSCAAVPTPSREEVYEFWDSDILRLFRQAGIPRRIPPDWHPLCGMGAKTHIGLAPKITSPRGNIVYNVRMNERHPDKVPFQAVTDADAGKVFWFLDNAFLGIAEAGRPFFWDPKPGEFQVRAVDNLGRAASGKIKVAMVE